VREGIRLGGLRGRVGDEGVWFKDGNGAWRFNGSKES